MKTETCLVQTEHLLARVRRLFILMVNPFKMSTCFLKMNWCYKLPFSWKYSTSRVDIFSVLLLYIKTKCVDSNYWGNYEYLLAS